MTIAPIVVIVLIALALRWLIARAHVTREDVDNEAKGPNAGAFLPSVNPDLRDAMPRSLALDADTERFRNSLPGGGASG